MESAIGSQKSPGFRLSRAEYTPPTRGSHPTPLIARISLQLLLPSLARVSATSRRRTPQDPAPGKPLQARNFPLGPTRLGSRNPGSQQVRAAREPRSCQVPGSPFRTTNPLKSSRVLLIQLLTRRERSVIEALMRLIPAASRLRLHLNQRRVADFPPRCVRLDPPPGENSCVEPPGALRPRHLRSAHQRCIQS